MRERLGDDGVSMPTGTPLSEEELAGGALERMTLMIDTIASIRLRGGFSEDAHISIDALVAGMLRAIATIGQLRAWVAGLEAEIARLSDLPSGVELERLTVREFTARGLLGRLKAHRENVWMDLSEPLRHAIDLWLWD